MPEAQEGEIAKIAAVSQAHKKPSRWFTLELAMDAVDIDGMWLEFGVFSGESIRLMAAHPKAPSEVHGFDSFTGLPPPETDGRSDWLTTRFDRGGVLPEVPANCELIKGWFSETLPAFLSRQGLSGRPAALVHVDSDIYSSAATVLRELTNSRALVPGTVVVFDELLHYPGWEGHEAKALWEWACERPGASWEWLCVKDRVLSAAQSRKFPASVLPHKQMQAQGYDQPVALRITSVGAPVGSSGV